MRRFILSLLLGFLVPAVSAQNNAPAPAVKAPLDFYGFQKPVALSEAVKIFNDQHAKEAKDHAQDALSESELIQAILFALGSLDPPAPAHKVVMEGIVKDRSLPVGSKFHLQTKCWTMMDEKNNTVLLWKIDLELGIAVPKDPTLELIPTDEELSRRWTIPVRLRMLGAKK